MPNRSIIAIIPARYASTRFPGKPLALIGGVPMIQRVYERVSAAKKVNELYVATDDRRIADVVEGIGGKVIMTSPSLKSGTDRCAFAARKLNADIIANIQGDEPLISPDVVDKAIGVLLKSPDTVMSTAAVPITDPWMLSSPGVVKVVLDKNCDALYFTRTAIPAVRDAGPEDYLKHFKYLKHLGIYIYRKEFLQKLTRLKETPLESAEKLEQLRVLENGYKIRVAIVDHDTISVDTPDDVRAVEKYLSEHAVGSDSKLKDGRSRRGKA